MKKILIALGTRPEAIKLAPIYRKLARCDEISTVLCTTGQHKEMVEPVLRFFKMEPDYNLELMTHNQSLNGLSSNLLDSVSDVLLKVKPDVVMVQGDTTTTFMTALAAFHLKIKIAHIEAGLRSFNKYSPFPEEINRQLTSQITDYHFAPTRRAKKNLLKSGINNQKVFLVGNSVIDALFICLKELERYNSFNLSNQFKDFDFSKKLIVVTGHRRENFGFPLKQVCKALLRLSMDNEIEIVYPVHLNPNVEKIVYAYLGNKRNIHLIKPLSYPAMVYLLSKSYLIISDSGGIQEEAPSLNKPVLVTREVTERKEGIEAGVCKLVGTNQEKIFEETKRLIDDRELYLSMSTGKNPYGDGNTAERVLKILIEMIEKNDF
jgi:UDP-N-acetylglucosamine 2-epimerase (non-hydrolysing)